MTLLSTGLVPVKPAEEKHPVNSSTPMKVPVRTVPPPSAKTQGAGAGGPPAAKRASLSASESSAFIDALLPSTSTNPAGPSLTSVSPGAAGAVSARQQALPAGLRVKRKATGAPATATASGSVSSLATSAVSSSKASSSSSSNTINVYLLQAAPVFLFVDF